MKILSKQVTRFIQDQRAAEVTEVGLYLAIIVASCVVLMAAIGPAVTQSWQDVATALGV